MLIDEKHFEYEGYRGDGCNDYKLHIFNHYSL